MKNLSMLLSAALIAAAAPTALHADLLTFPPGAVSPLSGDLSGYDGQTVTWGVSLFNDDSSNWWVITGVSSDYASSGAAGEIPDGSAFFTDLLSNYFFDNFVANNTALAPGQDLNLVSAGSSVDLASFAISPTAGIGTISGQLHIFYDTYDANPFDPDPNNTAMQTGSGVFDIDTSVTSLGPNPNGVSAVPEPAPLWTLTFSAAVIAFAKTRRRSRSN